MKVVGYFLLLAGVASMAFAGNPTPEIDPGMAGSAFALIGGVTLIVRSRRK